MLHMLLPIVISLYGDSSIFIGTILVLWLYNALFFIHAE